MVGFGGGSSYLALLAFINTPYTVIPIIALLCNIIVVTGGCFHFIRQGHLSWSLTAPFIISSVPCTYFAATIPISKKLFLLMLALTLFFAGLRILIKKKTHAIDAKELKIKQIFIPALSIGAGLGVSAGFIGIGGGIFLAPILHNFSWGTSKQIAATASVFILINSVSGIIGQFQKYSDISIVKPYWMLFPAVLAGGQIGSMLSSKKLSLICMQRLTGLLVFIVSLRLFYDLAN